MERILSRFVHRVPIMFVHVHCTPFYILAVPLFPAYNGVQSCKHLYTHTDESFKATDCTFERLFTVHIPGNIILIGFSFHVFHIVVLYDCNILRSLVHFCLSNPLITKSLQATF